MNRHVVVLGSQWGDEGKGKIVDSLVPDFDVIVRYQGGPNAGHTVVADGETHKLHILPSGILYSDKTCLIGDGVIVDPEILLKELMELKEAGIEISRLLLANRANLIMPWHKLRDGIAGGKIGTTSKGIGPTYTDLVNRRGIRVHDWQDAKQFKKRVKEEAAWNRLLVEAMAKEYSLKAQKMDEVMSNEAFNAEGVYASYRDALESLEALGLEIVDGVKYLADQDADGKRFLFEGAQGSMLDVIYGNYPYVTSSHITPGGIAAGTGYVPKELTVMGVMKAYTTRVGNGPFPTELTDEVGEMLREAGNEYGATTGRPRRCGWLDLEVLKHAIRINGIDMLVMTKLDILSGMESIDVAVGYLLNEKEMDHVPASADDHEKCVPVYESLEGWSEDLSEVREFGDLPKKAQTYVTYVSEYLGVPIKWIGVGPEREAVIEV